MNDIFDFDEQDDSHETEWRGMPEFNQPDNLAYKQVIISFEDDAGIEAFAKLINQNITKKTKSVWFPAREKNRVADLFWFNENE
jgi:hypothetical protein